MARIITAIVLFVHGFAHLVGFVGPWRLSKSIPYKTTILAGRFDLGDAGIKAIGVVWLLMALVFAVAGAGALLHARWWPLFTVVIAGLSTLLCIIGLPDAKIGVPVNLAILVYVLLAWKLGWSWAIR